MLKNLCHHLYVALLGEIPVVKHELHVPIRVEVLYHVRERLAVERVPVWEVGRHYTPRAFRKQRARHRTGYVLYFV